MKNKTLFSISKYHLLIIFMLLFIFQLTPYCYSETFQEVESSSSCAFNITIKTSVSENERDYTQNETVYSLDELEQMEHEEQEYSLLDKDKNVILVHAYGVNLLTILNNCKIDRNSIDSFLFQTKDGQTFHYSASELLSEKRYYFTNLLNVNNPDSYKEANGINNREQTDILIAWKVLWLSSSEYDIENIFEKLEWSWNQDWDQTDWEISKTAYQLLAGQKHRDDINAEFALSNITGIEILLSASNNEVSFPCEQRQNESESPDFSEKKEVPEQTSPESINCETDSKEQDQNTKNTESFNESAPLESPDSEEILDDKSFHGKISSSDYPQTPSKDYSQLNIQAHEAPPFIFRSLGLVCLCLESFFTGAADLTSPDKNNLIRLYFYTKKIRIL